MSTRNKATNKFIFEASPEQPGGRKQRFMI